MEEFLRKMEDTLELETGELAAETTLESIDWDSLSALTCLIMLQEDYGLTATNDDLDGLKTIGDIYCRFVKV